MSFRIRHCVECPQCHTWYLVGFSPYRNRAYLVRTGARSFDEYTLYCFCQGADSPNVCRWAEAKACEVSKSAHQRGYGALDEIWLLERGSREVSVDISRYLHLQR
jgi:hypothetical protein